MTILEPVLSEYFETVKKTRTNNISMKRCSCDVQYQLIKGFWVGNQMMASTLWWSLS